MQAMLEKNLLTGIIREEKDSVFSLVTIDIMDPYEPQSLPWVEDSSSKYFLSLVIVTDP